MIRLALYAVFVVAALASGIVGALCRSVTYGITLGVMFATLAALVRPSSLDVFER